MKENNGEKCCRFFLRKFPQSLPMPDHREGGGYASFISLDASIKLGRDAAMHSKSGLPSLEGR